MTKANLPLLSQVALGVLAGGFIRLGAMFFTFVVSDGSLSVAIARVVGGVAFSLELILVVVAGAELFTGNNLLVMTTAGNCLARFCGSDHRRAKSGFFSRRCGGVKAARKCPRYSSQATGRRYPSRAGIAALILADEINCLHPRVPTTSAS